MAAALFLAVACLPMSCERSTSASTVPARIERPLSAPPIGVGDFPIPASRNANDIARFMAGLEGLEGSPYLIYELQIPWILHSRACEKQWEKFERDRLPAMRSFQKSELTGPSVGGAMIFYPFGGPDVLTVSTLFPANRDYVLVGLEPPGTLPAFDQVVHSRPLQVQLPSTRRTLHSLLSVSFFVTREMDFQLRGQVFNGVLPVILVQIARMRGTVKGISYVTLSGDGRIVERPAVEDRGGIKNNRGVAIEFQREGETKPHRLYYFSLNLASDRLSQNKPFLAFLGKRKPMASFFKSTSYMPHHDQFALIRQQVLSQSGLVIQDDSGIPYRFYDRDQWRVQLYGGYDKPYGSFRYLQQQDLKEAFEQSGGVKKLGFGIGYGYGRIPSNLLVARKKG